MIQITPDQVTPALRSLFNASALPAGFRVFAILEGNAAGQILTDDPMKPTWAAIYEQAFGTIYPAGSVTRLKANDYQLPVIQKVFDRRVETMWFVQHGEVTGVFKPGDFAVGVVLLEDFGLVGVDDQVFSAIDA